MQPKAVGAVRKRMQPPSLRDAMPRELKALSARARAEHMLIGHEGLVFVLVVLAVTTNYTVVERLAYIRNKLKAAPAPAPGQ